MQESTHATSSAAALRTLVSDAIAAGARQRTEREQSEADRAKEALQRLIDAAPERAHTTLKAIPEIVHAAAAASHTRNSVCVMWLERHEYNGEFSVDDYSRSSEEPSRSSASLRHAGKLVFEAMVEAGLDPKIEYGYKPATGCDRSPTSRQVGIFISLS